MQRHYTKNLKQIFPSSSFKKKKQIFPEKELRDQSSNVYIQVSVSDLYIPMIDLSILLQEIMWTDIYKSLTET